MGKIFNVFILVFVTIVIFNACSKDDMKKSINSSLYGIKYGDSYGYIDSKGKIVLDLLNDGFIGELKGDKVYRTWVDVKFTEGSFTYQHVLHWKCYHRDGTVTNVTGDYDPGNRPYFVPVEGKYTFSENMAIVAKSGITYYSLYGFVDEDINEVIPCQYMWVTSFSDGLAAVQDTSSQKIGYVNKEGNYIIQPQYDFRSGHFSHGFNEGKAVVAIPGGNYQIIDKSNNVVVDLANLNSKYHRFIPSEKVSESLLRIETDEGTGFINMSGDWEISPMKHKVKDFKNGFAIAENHVTSKMFFINKSGNSAFQEEFLNAYDFDENDLAWVETEYLQNQSCTGKFINKTGNQAFEFECLFTTFFSNGLALVYDNEIKSWKYIDSDGKTVFVSPGEGPIKKPGYPDVFTGQFNSEGIALIRFKDNTYAYINDEGKTLWKSEEPYIYDDLLFN